MMDFERAAVPYWPIRRRKLLRRNLFLAFALCIVLAAIFGIRYRLMSEPLAARVFDEVASTVSLRYYDRGFHGLDWPSLVSSYRARVIAARDEAERYRLMQAMLARLGDSHTAIFSPAAVARVYDGGAADLGAAFVRIGNDRVVLRVAPNSPAAEAGFRPGFIVAESNAASDSGLLRTYAIRDPLSGRSWQKRLRPSGSRSAGYGALPSDLDWGVAAPGVAYLRMGSFPNDIEQALNWAISDVRTKPALILDLRENPGGLIDAVDATAGVFLPRNTPVVSGAGRYKIFGRRWFNATDTVGIHYDGRLAVIVDGSSESGAEALASTLQIHKRATIVGMPTARKVLGVEVEEQLPDGGLLRVATLDMRDANGALLEGRGVTPDILVRRTAADIARGRDPQLRAALRAVAVR